MTQTDRLQIENELMRELRTWYHPSLKSDTEVKTELEYTQRLIEINQNIFEKEDSDENAKVLLREVMKLQILEDILKTRDSFKVKLS